jgi:hypothetical protein
LPQKLSEPVLAPDAKSSGYEEAPNRKESANFAVCFQGRIPEIFGVQGISAAGKDDLTYGCDLMASLKDCEPEGL